jgi:hypothetical protein
MRKARTATDRPGKYVRRPSRRQPSNAAVNETSEEAPAAQAGSSKINAIIALLRQQQGATMAELIAATGWQAHSVRGAISGGIRAKRQMCVASDRVDGVRIYRIIEP